jgi:hypothetical protein
MASTLARFESSGFLSMATPKIPVYDNEEELNHYIVDARQTIHNCPGIIERMRRPKMRRVEACIESHGGHVYNQTVNIAKNVIKIFKNLL